MERYLDSVGHNDNMLLGMVIDDRVLVAEADKYFVSMEDITLGECVLEYMRLRTISFVGTTP